MITLSSLKKVAPSFYASGKCYNFISGPGVGKTSVVYQIAAMLSKTYKEPFGVLCVILSGRDPVDIRGLGVPVRGKDSSVPEVHFTLPDVFPNRANVEVFVDGELVEGYAEEHGVPKRGLLFFDEFAQSNHDLQKTAAQIMLDKRIGSHKLMKNWVVWTAGNRSEDRAGVVKKLSHVQNRACDLEIMPDYEAWQEWAFQNKVNPLIVAFAKANAGEVFRMSVPKEQGPYCTPRSLVMCGEVLEAMKTPGMGEHQLPDDPIATAVVAGWLGEGVMPKFMAHIRMGNDLPDVDDVIKNPTTTKIPDRIDARFVLTTSLAAHATNPKRAGAILKYITRMDTELQVMFVQAVVLRDPTAMATAEFGEWVSANVDLLNAAVV